MYLYYLILYLILPVIPSPTIIGVLGIHLIILGYVTIDLSF